MKHYAEGNSVGMNCWCKAARIVVVVGKNSFVVVEVVLTGCFCAKKEGQMTLPVEMHYTEVLFVFPLEEPYLGLVQFEAWDES